MSCLICTTHTRLSTVCGFAVVLALVLAVTQVDALLKLALVVMAVDRIGNVIQGIHDWNTDWECDGHEESGGD